MNSFIECYKKMMKKHLAFNELYDIRAVRILVPKLQDCYAALGAIHTRFEHVQKEFEEYEAPIMAYMQKVFPRSANELREETGWPE